VRTAAFFEDLTNSEIVSISREKKVENPFIQEFGDPDVHSQISTTMIIQPDNIGLSSMGLQHPFQRRTDK
jgi:hypothetical protein